MADERIQKETLVAFNKNWTDRVNSELQASLTFFLATQHFSELTRDCNT